MTQIVGIALSGGVDSALAADTLLRQGHQVRAYTMLLAPGEENIAERAAEVAEKLHVPHKVLDFRQSFREIILDYFVNEYAAGHTPSPCARCNQKIKFGLLLDAMLQDGCEKMATGHYARTAHLSDGSLALLRGRERNKDQSYFLGLLTQRQLAKVLFPVGDAPDKEEVKRRADELGLLPKETTESQDLCFLPNGAYAQFVEQERPALHHSGWILEEETGKRLGKHAGAYAYTVGQRRGLGLGGGPWFVSRVDMAGNNVLVSKSNRQIHTVRIGSVNWLCPEQDVLQGEVQLRFRMAPRPARLERMANGEAVIIFENGAPAVPAGQLACIYSGERLMAAGWILSSE